MAYQVVNDTQPSTGVELGGDAPNPNLILPLSQDPAISSYLAANAPVPWFSDGYLEAEYTFYAIQTVYTTDLGLQASPSTAPRAVLTGTSQGTQPATGPDQNNIVRVRRPITTKTVIWTAQRLGVKPLLPHWNTGSTNEKLMYRTISARNPLQTLNKKVWEVSGVYVYAFGKEPYITVNQVEYFVLPAAMSMAENVKNGLALHAFTQGDFAFTGLNTAWIPVNAPIDLSDLPVGFNARVGQPDSPTPVLGSPVKLGQS